MNYAAIKTTDVANGPGIRVSLFVSGCTHGCKGCFNREAWDFHYGKPYTQETEKEILSALAPDYIKGFSVLGGEPMEPENRKTVRKLLEKVRETYPQKSIWCYTGYDYEKDLLRWKAEEQAEREKAPHSAKQAHDAKQAHSAKQAHGGEQAEIGVISRLLELIDVLVDGEFVEEKKNLRLAFRGSENQRLIDVKKSEQQGKVVCLKMQS